MPHVVDAEHFLIRGFTRLLYGGEYRRYRQKIILNEMYSGAEAQAFRLAAAGAVYHSADSRAFFSQ